MSEFFLRSFKRGLPSFGRNHPPPSSEKHDSSPHDRRDHGSPSCKKHDISPPSTRDHRSPPSRERQNFPSGRGRQMSPSSDERQMSLSRANGGGMPNSHHRSSPSSHPKSSSDGKRHRSSSYPGLSNDRRSSTHPSPSNDRRSSSHPRPSSHPSSSHPMPPDHHRPSRENEDDGHRRSRFRPIGHPLGTPLGHVSHSHFEHTTEETGRQSTSARKPALRRGSYSVPPFRSRSPAGQLPVRRIKSVRFVKDVKPQHHWSGDSCKSSVSLNLNHGFNCIRTESDREIQPR